MSTSLLVVEVVSVVYDMLVVVVEVTSKEVDMVVATT